MIRLTLICTMIAVLLGCGADPGTSPPAPTMRVAAASDLQEVMPQLIAQFRARDKVEILATYGSSGQLAQQIKQGAPFDLFFSANRKFVADLAAEGVIAPASVRDYARGSLVLVVHANVPATVRSLADLSAPSVQKIAIANPDTAPYGLAARQALTTAGLWDTLEPKRVQAENVRQALQFVQTGNAEAGLVGKAIANIPGVRVIAIEDSLHEPLWQSVGIVADSTMPREASAFLTFVREGEGMNILRGAGFFVDVTP